MRRRLAAGVAALLVTGGLAALAWSAADARATDEVARARPVRMFAARLSMDTEYRRCTVVPAGSGGTVGREACGAHGDAPEELHALTAIGESSDPDSLRAAGLATMLWGDGAEPSLDEAISRLERALRLTREPGPLLADLSGAYLARAERTQNPRDLVQGLSYAREALAHDGGLRAALFNTALALETLAIDEQAARAWDAYLAADSASDWAAEARRRKDALLKRRRVVSEPGPHASTHEVEAFAARYPQEARLLGWDRVLGEWGAAVEAGHPAQAEALVTLAERLGNALEKRGGDATLADAVRAIRATARDSASMRRLARAHLAYARGQALYEAYDHPGALEAFDRVVAESPRSPVLLQWAQAFRGGARVYGVEYRSADRILSSLLSTVDSVRHPALAARARWMWSTAMLRTGRYPEARTQYGAAAGTFERLGEREFLGATLMLEGETAYEQGDTVAAYRSMHRALLELRGFRRSVWLHNQLLKLADCARTDGMAWAAAPVQDEDVAVAMRVAAPIITVEALLARARARAIAGLPRLAAHDLDAAVPLVPRIHAPGPQRWAEMNLRFSRSLIQPGKASPAALDSVVAFFGNNVVWLLPALMRRA
ncbi:MAG: hypothetical protein ICV87_10695, partial [Gemmatimonadetes bacterium]|nr:hypothetical protein [Gemmatimonadota bacterium]